MSKEKRFFNYTNETIGMNSKIKYFISKYADNTELLNKLVVTIFLKHCRHDEIKGVLSSYIVEELPTDAPDIPCIEDVISVFEQAIPKAEKTTNGAIYTPEYIRDYIVSRAVAEHQRQTKKELSDCLIADIACGCGAFLYTVAEHIQKATGQKYSLILHNLYGIDISEVSIERTKILLSLAALSHNDYLEEEDFNLFCENTLASRILTNRKVKNNKGFDIIVGNPPYVRAKNLDPQTKRSMKSWGVSRVGNPDLYIPFFEVGLSLLNESGVLGYITVNTFFKSVNARALRKLFHDNQYALTIINFGEERIFKGAHAYTCLVFLSKNRVEEIMYCKACSRDIIQKNPLSFYHIPYSSLNDKKGWHLSNPLVRDIIQVIESTGMPVGELYPIKNGIATLANDVYIFRQKREDSKYYYFEKDNKEIKIERRICKRIIKPNIVKNVQDIDILSERIIFPYNADYSIISEEVFKKEYPFAYDYLLNNRTQLDKRDKGKTESYPAWYSFGRTQALSDSGKRLLFPYMTDEPHFVLCEDHQMLIYCGYGIYCDDDRELKVLRRILESSVFSFYIKNTSKPYSKGYYSYAKNYIKAFGVPQLSETQKDELLAVMGKRNIDLFVIGLYDFTNEMSRAILS